MRHMKLVVSTAIVSACAASFPVQADISIVPGTLNMFRDFRGANDVGVGSGDRIQYGANIVGGSLGVSLSGTAATGFVDPSAPCGPLAVNAGFCSNTTAYNATRLAPWTFKFTRGAESLSVAGPSLAAAAGSPIPFPTSVTLSGTGVTPTISWQLPVGLSPDAFRINIYDKGQPRTNSGADNLIYSTAIASNATSFTLPQTAGLSSTGSYAVNFQIIETRDHGALVGNNNAAILSRSNSFVDFAPLSGSTGHDVSLPTIDSNGVNNFHVSSVGADHTTFLQSAVASGYRYQTGSSDPNFKSLLLPNVGDGAYTVSFVDGLGTHSVALLHDDQFFFGGTGVSDFTVSNIETSTEATAFITGLTFAGNGDFTGTMTPLSVAAVPEPSTYALMMLGLAGIGYRARRRRAQ